MEPPLVPPEEQRERLYDMRDAQSYITSVLEDYMFLFPQEIRSFERDIDLAVRDEEDRFEEWKRGFRYAD